MIGRQRGPSYGQLGRYKIYTDLVKKTKYPGVDRKTCVSVAFSEGRELGRSIIIDPN